jgi:hypothetical protein
MSVRNRQSVLFLILLLVCGLAVFLAACGGSGAQATSTSNGASGTAGAASNPASASAAGTHSAAGNVGGAVQQQEFQKLATTQDTPEEYVAAVGQARPIAILFYVPGNVDDAKVLDVFKSAQADFPDYTFLTYDYKSPQNYGDLSLLLDVNYPPETVLINKAGEVRQIWNGYVDDGTLKQCLINVGQE